jgi:hypothetical protein
MRTSAARAIATSIKIEARLVALRRLAKETSEIYNELIRCKTPPEVARDYFLVSGALSRPGAGKKVEPADFFERGGAPTLAAAG